MERWSPYLKDLPIPEFPKSKEFLLNAKNDIRLVTSTIKPYSDLSFTSLFCWDIDDSTNISQLNGNLIIEMKHYTEDRKISIPIGDNEVVDTTQKLLNNGKQLELVPEEFIDKLQSFNHEFDIQNDEANYDYIISTEKNSKMQGGEFSKKRAKVSRFLRDNPDCNFMPINPVVFKDGLIALFDTWALAHQNTDDHTAERKVLLKYLDYKENFNTSCLALFLNNSLVGFNIVEFVNDVDTYGFLLKVDTRIIGANEYIIQQTSEYLHNLGYKTINIAQDLGIESIKRFKEELRPIEYLKKYKICQKN